MSQDNTRHKRRSTTEWQQLIASGLSQRVFCQQQGVALSSFQYWKRRLDSESEPPPASAHVTDLGDPRPAAETLPAAID